jgi:hypothetical protein
MFVLASVAVLGTSLYLCAARCFGEVLSKISDLLITSEFTEAAGVIDEFIKDAGDSSS